jgi:uncharacterized protein
MQYRDLGRTGLKVSAIGLGCAQLGSSDTGYALQIVQRALDLGVNFFDVARLYRDAEIKLGLALQGQRQKAIVSSKTMGITKADAWLEIHQSLERLGTDYIDNYHLHNLEPGGDVERRTGTGGALEALMEAKAQGLIRHIGCTSHRSDVLIDALGRFDFETILVPMNIVERDPLKALIPLCQQRGVGVTIMKPVATGLLPATLALKWMLNQPVATAAPGCTTVEEIEENARVGSAGFTLSSSEYAEVERLRSGLEHTRCRICWECMPCPQGICVQDILGTDVMFDHYRTMGDEGFRAHTWSRSAIEKDLREREKHIASIEGCDRCGQCEEKCPHGLPVIEMLQQTLPTMRAMASFYHQWLDA